MKAYTMGARALTESSNQTKEIFTDKMVEEGVITPEQGDIMNKHSILITEKSYLGTLWNKWWDKEGNYMKIVVVKVLE